MGLEQLLGGFAKGFGQARMMKMQREKDKETTGLQKDFLKLQMKEKEASILDKKRKAELESLIMQSSEFQRMLGISQETPSAQPTQEKSQKGESFGKGSGGLTDQLATSQMDPMMAEMLQKFTGIDVPGAMRTEIAQEQLGVSKGGLDLRQKQFERSGSEWKTESIPDGKGGSVLKRFNKYTPGEGVVLGVNPPPVESFKEVTPEGTFRNVVQKNTQDLISKHKVEKAKGESPEKATKITAAIKALKHVGKIRGLLKVDSGGEPDKWIVSQIALGIGPGREIMSLFKEAIDTKIRGMTGAAVSSEEWPMYFQMYLPMVRDLTQPGLIADKLNRFEEFMQGYVKMVDPGGEFQQRLGEPSEGVTKSGIKYKIRKK